MRIGYNGSVVESGDAAISVYDHGFLYGLGLFETFRTYKGVPYLLDRHLARLSAGCAELGIEWKADARQLQQHLRELMDANGLQDAYVRLTITAGDAGLGLPADDYHSPVQIVMVKPLPPVPEGLYSTGKELCLLRTPRNTPEGAIRFKSLHYMNNIMAKRELRARSAPASAEGLMLTKEGWLAEGIVSNLFFAANGILHTPAIATGILPGITRQRVLELAKAAGFRFTEGFYRMEDLLSADEVWMTGSVQELVPITSLYYGDEYYGLQDTAWQHTTVGNGTIGPVCQELLEMYRQDTVSPQT